MSSEYILCCYESNTETKKYSDRMCFRTRVADSEVSFEMTDFSVNKISFFCIMSWDRKDNNFSDTIF